MALSTDCAVKERKNPKEREINWEPKAVCSFCDENAKPRDDEIEMKA